MPSMMFVGPDEVACFRAIVIAGGLKFYAKTGHQVNRAYTPTRMLDAARAITGTRFKRGQYLEAASALETWVRAHRAVPYDPPYESD